MGREQIPRLEAIVDAVGTVEVNDGGEGYRENPDLVFWYGSEENKTDLEHNYTEYAVLESNLTENNTTHGTFAYVGGEDDSVYSFHLGKEVNELYLAIGAGKRVA